MLIAKAKSIFIAYKYTNRLYSPLLYFIPYFIRESKKTISEKIFSVFYKFKNFTLKL
jgi:hypothetical protein